MEKNLGTALKGLLYKYRWRFFQGLIMVTLSNGLLILNPLIFRQAVISVGLEHSIWPWVMVLITTAFISALFKYGMRMAFVSVSRDAEYELRAKLFGRIQNQSMAFFDKHGIGELLSRLTNDITAYRDLLGPGVMYPLFFLTLVGPGLAALFYISSKLASIALIPLFTIPLVNILFRKSLYNLSSETQALLAKMSSLVQEHYSSIRIIKSYTMEKAGLKKFIDLCLKFFRVNLVLSGIQGALFPFFAMLTKFMTLILVLFSGIIIYQGWGELSTADFVSFMWIQSYIFFPIILLGWLIPVYQRGKAAYDRLVEIYEEPIEVASNSASQFSIPQAASISFRNLTFTYPGKESPALRAINLEIEGGSFVGITGAVGSGKSTLIRLLNREYEIPHGMIYIGGKELHEYPLDSFYQEMAIVEQSPFLFSRSIGENVRLGKNGSTQEEVEAVAREAALHDTILEFPELYDTLVGERGVTLSGGQKQRLAMARAFLVNRSILLLDDVFSAIDSATESLIFESMKKNFKNKTVLLITHRASLLMQMDRVIYIADGTIIEDGKTQDLIKKDGPFAALVEIQRLGH